MSAPALQPSGFLRNIRGYRPSLSVNAVALLASLFFTLFCNNRFFEAIAAGRSWADSFTWLFVAAFAVALTSVHFAGIALLLNRWTIRPVLTVLIAVTAMAMFYMERFGVFFDTSMVRSVLYTQVKEARELVTPALIPHMLVYAALPIALLWRVQIKRSSWHRAVLSKIGAVSAALLLAVGAALLVFQDASALMRNQKDVRHLITPGDYLVSLGRVLVADTKAAGTTRIPVGTDAKLLPAKPGSKPTLLILVVGETARAANWGLNGYSRQTTPELAGLDVLNFPQVTSCGSNTEVSLPCMFSPFGRKDYNESKIRRHESLLHVMKHAGIATLWRDNQTGCKGVCSGLPMEQVDDTPVPGLCDGEQCLDEILLEGLNNKISNTADNMVVVLHQLGNHGPAYFRRYPEAFRRFTPTCDTQELGECTQEQIVNAYDNALLYTDHFLSRTIEFLKAQNTHNAVMLYVSDHGESLGEDGLFLHGIPYAFAPDEQTHVPMVMWFSPEYSAANGLDMDCMRKVAAEPTSHDALFHSVLGLMRVQTSAYDPSLDLTLMCRKQDVSHLAR